MSSGNTGAPGLPSDDVQCPQISQYSCTLKIQIRSGIRNPVNILLIIAQDWQAGLREKYLQSHAVNFIIKETKKLFPPQILKVFLNQISLFPVNSYVRLNNQSIGRVVSTDENQPLRPSIEILYDGLSNKAAEREVIRLPDNPLLYITESFDQKELP